MRFGPTALVALSLGVSQSCAHEAVAVQGRTPVHAAAVELIRQGHAKAAQAMLETSVEATESELADLYRALGDACQAQRQQARADEWYGKGAAMKKFKAAIPPVQPLPADLPARKLP